MTGSETFIIVALRCTENRTPWSLASAICSDRNAFSAAARITDASITSPVWSDSPSLSTVVVPSAAACSIRTVVASGTVTDCSVLKKSPSLIVETCEAESRDHAPIECGWCRANALTDAGARRSELPWRSTGLTALPLTLSYRLRMSRCASSAGSSG